MSSKFDNPPGNNHMGINCLLLISANKTYYLLLIFSNENSVENMATTHSLFFKLSVWQNIELSFINILMLLCQGLLSEWQAIKKVLCSALVQSCCFTEWSSLAIYILVHGTVSLSSFSFRSPWIFYQKFPDLFLNLNTIWLINNSWYLCSHFLFKK